MNLPRWKFRALTADEVEQDPTQRDQFNNDEVGLADALVRESVQNSTDAPGKGGIVKVRFCLSEVSGDAAARMNERLAGLQPHLLASGVSKAPLGGQTIPVLTIEDFNTSGLTGDPAALDNGHFRNFWRVHGRSGKSGNAGGRWGLGKLVYSSSSKVHAFFGCTVREGDLQPLLMGQAVLLNHEVAGMRHPAHGFWFSDEGLNRIQLPITDGGLVTQFCTDTGLKRGMSPGFSVVVPYPMDVITEPALLSGVIQNYYFPILAGRLVVEVGTNVLDRDNFLALAEGRSAGDIPFDFVGEVSARLDSSADFAVSTPVEDTGLSEGHFAPSELELLREAYSNGNLVHVSAPISLRTKAGEAKTGRIELFLKKPTIEGDSFSLFVRGSLTVPGERRHFSGVPAYGAMVVTDPDTTAFLGDAENPAHTSWNPQAEKVTRNWQSPYVTLKGIRNALRSLHRLVADQVEREDREALIDFFSIADPLPVAGKRRRKTPIPEPIIKNREKALVVRPMVGGFEIAAGPGAALWEFPKKVRVRAAYDMLGADPFKRFSVFDFDLAKGIHLEPTALDVAVVKPNAMLLTLTSPHFRLHAHGFDQNRDLVVEARSVG